MLDDKLLEYAQAFDDGFPMIPLGCGRTDDEIIKIIDKCLQHKKDVYKMGYITDDEEVYY